MTEGYFIAVPRNGTKLTVRKRTISSTVTPRNFVVLNTDGTVTDANASSTALYGVVVGNDYKAGGAAVTEVLVAEANMDTEFEGVCTGTLTTALVGDFVDLEMSGALQKVNENAGSTKVLKITDVINATDKILRVAVVPSVSQADAVEVS